MKLAVIGNNAEQRAIQEMYLGYHFVLGQELFRDEHYYYFYKNRRDLGHFIIVDNGAAEPEDERIEFGSIAHAAMEMDADEIIMPDVLRNKEATLAGTLDPDALSMVPAHKRFVVPQGRDWKEWVECLEEMKLAIDFVTVGIPKWTEELPGGRAQALKLLIKMSVPRKYNIHLLGIHSKPFMEVATAHAVFNRIRGVDTAAPFAYAQNGYHLTDDKHFSHDWNKENYLVSGSGYRNVRKYWEFVSGLVSYV